MIAFTWAAVLQFAIASPCSTWVSPPPDSLFRELACREHWREADSRLRAWKDDPNLREGGAEVLFWQGWSALRQGRRSEADTLFMLASAYAGERRSQTALEYRYALLIDSGKALADYTVGLPENPWPDSSRQSALKRVPDSSPLKPHARWEEAMLLRRSGNRTAMLAVLEELSKQTATLPGRRAAALLAFFQEPFQPDSALAAFERLLLEYQQGVPAEFARNRIQALKKRTRSP